MCVFNVELNVTPTRKWNHFFIQKIPYYFSILTLLKSVFVEWSFTKVNILSNLFQSNFAEAFKAFTVHPIWDLNTFEGKKVCFKNIVLPLLPRMIYGLYYNTPLFSNCQNSGLFRAFSHFIPHRLGVESASQTDSRKLRVTIIRRLTKFRRILNLGTLVEVLEKTGKFEVTVAEFSHSMPFKKQLQIVRNTDILVGIHGAGTF